MDEKFVFADLSDKRERELKPICFEDYNGILIPKHKDHLVGMLVSEEEKEYCVNELAWQIRQDYLKILAPGEALVVTPLLNGALNFSKDLMDRLYLPIEVDALKVESYPETTESSGEVKIHKDFSRSVKNRHVLLVEDIVDTRRTIDFVINGLLAHKRPKSVRVATFLDKVTAMIIDIPVNYVGFEIPEMFVVGYGLDYKHELRNLPFVGVYKL